MGNFEGRELCTMTQVASVILKKKKGKVKTGGFSMNISFVSMYLRSIIFEFRRNSFLVKFKIIS